MTIDSNAMPFEIVADEAYDPIGIEIEVYDRLNPSQRVDVLPRRWGVKYLEEMDGDGGGSIVVPANDPKLLEDPTLLQYRNVIKVRVGGVIRGAFVIQKRRTVVIGAGEHAEEAVEVSGPGLRSWLNDALIYPQGGLNAKSPPTRAFNFASEQGDWYNPADWVAATAMSQQDSGRTLETFSTVDIEKFVMAADLTSLNPVDPGGREPPGEDPDGKPYLRRGKNNAALYRDSRYYWDGTELDLPADETKDRGWQIAASQIFADVFQVTPFSSAVPPEDPNGQPYFGTKVNGAALYRDSNWWYDGAGWHENPNDDDQMDREEIAPANWSEPNPHWANFPADWPVAARTARWIWDRDARNDPYAPVGFCYFRKEFTVTENVTYDLLATGDNTFKAYLDGSPILGSDDFSGWQKTYRQSIELTPGTHVLGIRCYNVGGPAGLLVSVLPNDWSEAADQYAVTPILQSGSDWVVSGYPDPPPGWSPGEIMATLLDEAKARGVLVYQDGYLSLDATSESDSAGVNWGDPLDWEFSVAESIGAAVEKMEEVQMDLRIDPSDCKIYLYVDQGVDRSAQTANAEPVVFRKGWNALAATVDGVQQVINTLLIQDEQGLQEVSDLPGTEDYGRIENALDLNGQSRGRASSIAAKTFDKFRAPQEAYTLEIHPREGCIPWVDFKVGDWVLAVDTTQESGFRRVRVMSISIEESDTGVSRYTIEVDSISQNAETRIARWQAREAQGSVSGQVVNATPGAKTGGAYSAPGSGALSQGPAGPQGPRGATGPQGPVGLDWRGEWDLASAYSIADAVSFDGSSYIAIAASTNKQPDTNPSYWSLLTLSGADGVDGRSFIWKGAWSGAMAYSVDDVVSYQGTTYIAIQAGTNKNPATQTSFWSVMAQKGDTGPTGDAGPAGADGFAPRQVASLTTASISNDSTWNGTVSLANAYRLLKIATDVPARVRVYADVASRTADAGRPIGADPTGPHGVIMDFVTTAAYLTWWMNPVIDGYDAKTTPDGVVPVAVTNLSGATGTVTVDLTYTRSE